MVTEQLGRGATIYAGQRGFGSTGHPLAAVDILFMVTTRLELTKLTGEATKIDPQVFIVMHSVRETKGGLGKKRALQ